MSMMDMFNDGTRVIPDLSMTIKTLLGLNIQICTTNYNNTMGEDEIHIFISPGPVFINSQFVTKYRTNK